MLLGRTKWVKPNVVQKDHYIKGLHPDSLELDYLMVVKLKAAV